MNIILEHVRGTAGRYSASLEDRRVLIPASRDPLPEAARVLLSEGRHEATVVTTRFARTGSVYANRSRGGGRFPRQKFLSRNR